MKDIGVIFFIMTPFGYLCTRNNTGLITGTIFLILGLVCYNWDKIADDTPTIKIPNNEFWEYHYKDAVDSRGDTGARDWATTICGYHNAWVPPESRQEQIAQQVLHPKGIKTDVEKRRIEDRIDRLQFAKWYTLKYDFIKRYDKMGIERFIEDEWKKRSYKIPCESLAWLPPKTDQAEIEKIKSKNEKKAVEEIYNSFMRRIRQCFCSLGVSPSEIGILRYGYLQRTFGQNTEENVWDRVISQGEKSEAIKWANECVERVFKETDEDVNQNKYFEDVRIDFDYQKKYGFRIEED